MYFERDSHPRHVQKSLEILNIHQVQVTLNLHENVQAQSHISTAEVCIWLIQMIQWINNPPTTRHLFWSWKLANQGLGKGRVNIRGRSDDGQVVRWMPGDSRLTVFWQELDIGIGGLKPWYLLSTYSTCPSVQKNVHKSVNGYQITI